MIDVIVQMRKHIEGHVPHADYLTVEFMIPGADLVVRIYRMVFISLGKEGILVLQ
jgi:hypothetical protein